MKHPLKSVISGGQVGADRAGLDAAMEFKYPVGGYCPRGRRAVDGRIPDRYPLIETSTPAYDQRTRKNVQRACGTVIFFNNINGRGTQLTIKTCINLGKPHITIDASRKDFDYKAAGLDIARFVTENHIVCLNVAGSRLESVYPNVKQAMVAMFERLEQ